MKYRFLIVKSKRPDFASLYQFLLTTDEEGEVIPLEVDGSEQLDEQVEKMLNEDGYAKSDFIIVKVVDYTIDAKDYSDTEDNNAEDPGEDPGEDTGEDGSNTEDPSIGG